MKIHWPSYIVAFLLLGSSTVHAARIVSDPYPASAAQPDSCAFIEGTAAPVVSSIEIVTGGVRCSIVLPSTISGSHTYQIFAKSSVWGDSSAVNFTFIAGKPAAPSGLRIVP